MLHFVIHYYQKLKTVGLSRCIRAVNYRLQRALFIKKMRKRTLTQNDRLQIPARKKLLGALSFLDAIKKKIHREHVLDVANRYKAGWYNVLGSGEQSFTKMPWHEDIRLSAQDPIAAVTFDARQFYADISIGAGDSKSIEKDIKVPWELSRFHHLPVLALAYAITDDVSYAQVAKEQITDWCERNPYLWGINWVCPMEVAIRATNWIVAWYWLRDIWQKDDEFYRRLLSSLRNHREYLEGNWEFYDGRTSNHYLSNLVGYLYLCWFFNDEIGITQKRDRCYQELIHELDWQIFEEGTSYEGSTRYHQLVTELTIHGFLLAREMGLAVSPTLLEKIDRMCAFLDWCSPAQTEEVVAIGDDDSGSLLHKDVFTLSLFANQLIPQTCTFFGVKRYPQFGLSISKADDWHVTLRHHAYHQRQPAGHFHDDAGSITIAYKGMPVVVDPGSYLYTASRTWRDQFRSSMMHNVCYVPQHDKKPRELFALDIPEVRDEHLYDKGGVLQARHYVAPYVLLDRKITIDEKDCMIIDHAASSDSQIMKNFIFAPEISVQKDAQNYLLMYQQKPLLHFSVPMHVQVTLLSTWIAPHYGKKIRTMCLQVLHGNDEPVLLRVV